MSIIMANPSREKTRYRVRGELAICLIAVINSFAVYLMLHSLGGMPSISSVPYIISEVYPVASLGAWTYLFQTVLVAILIAMRLQKGEKGYVVYYLCSFLVGGLFSVMMDIHALWIGRLPQTFFLCIFYFGVSFLALAFGIALSNYCKMPIIPTDLFPRELTLILGQPYKQVKTRFDIGCLVFTLFWGLIALHDLRGIGLGTVLCALTLGKIISAIGNWLDTRFVFDSILDPEHKKSAV